MSEKKYSKINKRKTARNRHSKQQFIISNMNNLLSIIDTIIVKNNLKTDVFKKIVNEIYSNIFLFSNQLKKIGENKIKKIENDMMKIKYNRKTDIKSKLFGYIELLNDFGIYLNKEKYKEILNTRDAINNHLHHFILLLNDTTFLATEEVRAV